jgi:hypothetical protein
MKSTEKRWTAILVESRSGSAALKRGARAAKAAKNGTDKQRN